MDEVKFPVISSNISPLIIGNAVFKSAVDYGLSEDETKKASLELGETDEKIVTCLQELREKLSKDEDVHYRVDEAYLLRYLRARKFNCDKAYEHLNRYYHLRKTRPDFFNVPKNLEAGLNSYNLKILPYTDEEGRLIFWIDLERWNPETMPFENEAGTGFLIYDIITMNPRCQVNGCIGIFDMKKWNRRHISTVLKQNRLYTFFELIQYCYPWRVKKLFLINSGQLVRFIYSLLQPLLSKKIKERIVFLGFDLNELHQYIDPAILPKKLGGLLEEDACNLSTQLVLDNLPYLEYERSFK